MKVIVSSPAIAPHIRQNVMAYFEAGMLQNFYTAFFTHPDSKLAAFLSRFSFIKGQLHRRAFNDLPVEYFVSRPFPELLRTLSARKLHPVITDLIWEWAEVSFDKWVGSKLPADTAIVHTYEHAALNTIKAAAKKGIFTIYEQVSQHHSFFLAIAKEQLKMYPQLQSKQTELLVNKKAVKRNKRRDEELRLADMILCNSTFTKDTLINAGVNENKIKVLPLAFPAPIKQAGPAKKNGPVKFLYAGTQSLRKGTHILYDAWRNCNFKEEAAELWLIGNLAFPAAVRENLPGKVIIKNNIPHNELIALYSKADVFVLPTLADGFGMVVTEAMSQGIPVITTANSCGPDIITHNKNGWIIPAGDTAALVAQMQAIVNNKEQLDTFSNEAVLKAGSWQWADYRKAFTELVAQTWKATKQ